MRRILAHLFFPRSSNNHRPKILHQTSIFAIIVFLFFSAFVFSDIHKTYPNVLGVSSDLSYQDLLVLTNQARQAEGVGPLSLNSQLSQAAQNKADDMFANNYWAHNSPSGKTPWDFIKDSGYDYIYAGENLARGFTSASDVINAWLASPEHRDNMLSRNFSDVGFAVEAGNLSGESTVLVVEELGGRKIVPPQGKTETLSTQNQANPKTTSSKISVPKINSMSFSSNLSEIILIVFISTLAVDLILIERKKIARVVGHNLDHILFFSVIMICIIVLSRGIIL